MKLCACLTAATLAFAATSLAQESAPVTAHEKLAVLEPLIGTWMTEDIAEQDWEAIALHKGDILVRRVSFEWITNQNAILHKIVAERKNGEKLYDLSTEIICWDAGSQRIISLGTGPYGGVVRTEWKEDGSSWIVKSSRRLLSGEERLTARRVTIANNTIKREFLDADGQPEPREPDILTRVK